LSEEQTPQVVVFSKKSSEKGEQKDRVFVRPRQVRYQAALRPDILFDYKGRVVRGPTLVLTFFVFGALLRSY
jgi:hypothetical protein